MNSAEIRQRFLSFFEKRGHAIIPSASLVAPEESATDKTLFTTAGMQPLIPYLLGKEHPFGTRLVDIQKCVRTGDIDDVGDNRHLTFFEMLGNWSLGDYFKKEAIAWSYQFLTNGNDEKEGDKGLGLDINRLYVTIFEGDENAPLDIESKEIWMSLGVPEHRIYPLGAEDNWWSPGESGPCGPDTEMFYDLTEKGLGDMTKEQFIIAVQKEDAVEIWNDVFMEYEKKGGKVIGKLAKKNVDTGAGLERIAAVMQGKKTAYETDLFIPLISKVKSITLNSDVKSERIIADHIRTVVFMISDGVRPANSDRGYILRRIIRRAARQSNKLIMSNGDYGLLDLVDVIAESYKEAYPALQDSRVEIKEILKAEIDKFQKILRDASKIVTDKNLFHVVNEGEPIPEYIRIKGSDIFPLYSTHGVPVDIILDEVERIMTELFGKLKSDYKREELIAEFNDEMRKHQDLSRSGAEQKFKGGLADTSETSVKYHTATHLLHQALHDVLGDEVGQKGSNITPERLRFDFSFSRKMTDEEKQKIEDIVNEKIKESLPIQSVVMPKAEAEKTGARHFFGEKYPDLVSIYYIGNSLEDTYSKEFCGGPHISNTSELGHFKIQKEEAVSAGVRRIKAILE